MYRATVKAAGAGVLRCHRAWPYARQHSRYTHPWRPSRPADAGATTPTRAVPEDPGPQAVTVPGPQEVTDPGPQAVTNPAAGFWRRTSRALRRWWPVMRWVAGLGILAVALDVLSSHTGELSTVGTVFTHLRWWWLLPALGAEAASVLSFVGLATRLLAAGGLRPPLVPLAGVTLASQALSNSVPAGPAAALVYGFRWYRRLGADDTLASWALVGTTVFAALSLALLAGIGLVLATDQGASLNLVPAVLGALVGTLVLGALFVYERPLEVVARWALEISGRLFGRPRGDHERQVIVLLERLSRVRLSTPGALEIVGWGFMNWLFDCICFALAFLATGSPVPWKGLLLAYGAGQLAANLPITPGGLGVVEGSITIALAYFGGGTAADIAAVLVYRLISFWLVLFIGWGSWSALALGVRRGRWPRSALRAQVEPGVLTATADPDDPEDEGEGHGGDVRGSHAAPEERDEPEEPARRRAHRGATE